MTEESKEAVRVNTRISAGTNDWLDRRAKETGIPKSTIINIALEQYVMQLRSVDALELSQGTLKDLFAKVERIEEKLSSVDVTKS